MDIESLIKQVTHLPFHEVTEICNSNSTINSYCMDPQYSQYWKELIEDTFGNFHNYSYLIQGRPYNYFTYVSLVETLDPISQLMIYYRQQDVKNFNNAKFNETQRFLALFMLGDKTLTIFLPTVHYQPFVDLLDGQTVDQATLDKMVAEMAKNGSITGIKYMINLGGKITPYAVDGALEAQKIEAVRYLLANAPKLSEWSTQTLSKLLSIAAEKGFLEIVKFMVKQGADIHYNNEDALTWSSRMGQLPVVKYLVEQGANIHVQYERPFRSASLGGHLDVVKYLVEQGANIHVDHEEALISASAKGHLPVVKYLVEQGADIHVKNNQALDFAIHGNHPAVVKYLQEQGAGLPQVPGWVPYSPPSAAKSMQPMQPISPPTSRSRGKKPKPAGPVVNILNVYDLLHLPVLTPDPNALLSQGNELIYKGVKYEGSFYQPQRIGEGWNGIVECCSVVDEQNAVIKYPNRPVDTLQVEFVVYDQLLNYFNFPVVPIIDRGANYEFLIRPYKDPQYFGNNLILNQEQKDKLKELWIMANGYALTTGIPLDLKPDNIWWDEQRKEWLLVDTGPRLDDGDNHKFAYTLDAEDADEYIQTYFIDKKGEDALRATFHLRIYPDHVELDSMGTIAIFSPGDLKTINVQKYLEDKIIGLITKDKVDLLKIYLKGIVPTEKILKYARGSIEVSKLLCQIHKICPTIPTYQKFTTEIDTITKLRQDTHNFHTNLTQEEKKVLRNYTGHYYRDMNECLRENYDISKCDAEIRKDVIMLQDILSRQNVPRTQNEIFVFRGIEADRFESKQIVDKLKNMEIGEIYEDRAFISTSVQYPPSGFVGKSCCILRIRLPAQTPAYYIGKDSSESHEEEVILLPGTSFRLMEKKQVTFSGRKVNLFVFDCYSCLNNARYPLSIAPSEFGLYQNVRSSAYQLVDTTVGKNRLNLEDLLIANQYIPETNSEVIRVMTWNVHEWRDAKGRETNKEIENIIKQINPDIVGLQEVTENPKNNYLMAVVSSRCKADPGTHGQLFNTLTVLSKATFTSFGGIDLGPRQRCAVRSDFMYSGQPLTVINLHLEVVSPEDRAENIQRLLNNIKKPETTIIMGDFNSYLKEDYTPQNLQLLEKSKEGYGLDFETLRSLQNAGYIDTYQLQARNYGIPVTQIVPANTTDKAGRVDFIFLHKNSNFTVKKMYTYYTAVSDHIPLILDLELNKTAIQKNKLQSIQGSTLPAVPVSQLSMSQLPMSPIVPLTRSKDDQAIDDNKGIDWSQIPKTTDEMRQYIESVRVKLNKASPPSDLRDVLREASYRGRLDMVKFLVTILGVDPNSYNSIALRAAAQYGHLDVIKYLISRGVDPHNNEDLALRIAKINKQPEVIKYLESLP